MPGFEIFGEEEKRQIMDVLDNVRAFSRFVNLNRILPSTAEQVMLRR
jgi:hypothetical protein